MPASIKPANRLLALLPSAEYRRLLPKLERVALNFKEEIYNIGDTIGDVYFPESGIISLLAAIEDSATLEVGIVGSEGMIGLPVFLGVKKSNNQAIVQGAGFALRIKTKDFVTECEIGGALLGILRRYTHSLMTQISQSAVCYRFHPVEMRLARWLLMSADRIKTHEFPTTQEFLSNMLGVRREAVTLAVRELQRRKLISSGRGLVKILNRQALESAVCRCYSIIKTEEKSFPKNLKT